MNDICRPVFLEFPQDSDLWWIKWVDGYRPSILGTNSPGVGVLLSRLPFSDPKNMSQNTLKSVVSTPDELSGNSFKTWIHTGGIPSVKIGDIYRNGTLVERLPFEVGTFTLDTKLSPPTIVKASDSFSPKPPGWGSDINCRVLNRSEYSLKSFLQTHCVMVRQRNQTVLIPCQEIFRVFFANHSNLANALTSGIWGHNRNSLVDISRTMVIPPNLWHVHLNTRTSRDCVHMLACLLLDECAHNEARRVSRHLAHRELNDISEKFIGANIPFPPGPLIFNARYHILRDDPGHRKILITSIFQTTWPYPEQVITYSKDVTGKDEEDDLDINFQHDLLRKLKTKKPTPVIGPGRTQITTGGNPSKKYSPFDMPLPDFTWDDIAKAKFIPVSVQRKFPKRKVVPIQADEDPLGSFAHPYLGTGDLGPNEVRLVHLWELPHRFSLLINALQSLVKDPKHGKFQWEIVTPTGFATTISQGTAWAFQLDTISENDMRIPPQWKAINYKDKRPRTALICRIEHAGTSVYWLELECRSQESGFCALLFQPKTGKAHECIEELLLAAPPAKGVWSQKTITDDNCPSLLRWKARKHHFIKTKFTKPQNTDLDRAGSAIPKETTENASAGEANATGSAESQDIAEEQPEVIQASWVAKVFLEFVGEEMS